MNDPFVTASTTTVSAHTSVQANNNHQTQLVHNSTEPRHSQPIARYALILSLLTILLTAASCSPKKSITTEFSITSNIINKHIEPNLSAFAVASEKLDEAIQRFCHNPSNPGEFAATQHALQHTQLAWSLVRAAPIHSAQGMQYCQQIESVIWHTSSKSFTSIYKLLYNPRGLQAFNIPELCNTLTAASKTLLANTQALKNSWHPKQGNHTGKLLSNSNTLPIIQQSLANSIQGLYRTVTFAFTSPELTPNQQATWLLSAKNEATENKNIYALTQKPQQSLHSQSSYQLLLNGLEQLNATTTNDALAKKHLKVVGQISKQLQQHLKNNEHLRRTSH